MNFEAIKASIRREIQMKLSAYPGWVKNKKHGYTKESAISEILRMEEALACVEFTEAIAKAGKGLKLAETTERERYKAIAEKFA
jgi:hypothetical protein